MQERHQERLDSVEFGTCDGVVMREIVEDVPCKGVMALESCECARLHEGYVRMPTLKVLAARWSLRLWIFVQAMSYPPVSGVLSLPALSGGG
jgi:hypothetical protein